MGFSQVQGPQGLVWQQRGFVEMPRKRDIKHDVKKAPPNVVPEGEDEDVNDDDPDACQICFEHKSNTCIIECGHACMCISCSRALYETQGNKWVCPKCREPITRVIRMFK